MKRWFYTDPLAAAWMHQHFGMTFETQDQKERIDRWVIDGLISGRRTNPDGVAEKYDRLYIHPDSIRLLEPRVGDIAQHPSSGNCYQLEGISCLEWFASVGMKIVRRNGTAFMWPESETA